MDEGAGAALQPFLQADSKDAELADYLNDASCKHAYHYLPFTSPPGTTAWKPQVVQPGPHTEFRWPDALAAQLRSQPACRVGLLPEIHRAWALVTRTVNGSPVNELALWNYEASRPGQASDDAVSTVQLSGGAGPWACALGTVALVVPKADQIVATKAAAQATASPSTVVKYYLVVTFADQVQIFSLAFERDSVHGKLQIAGKGGQVAGASPAEPVFRALTDGVTFTAVAGTQHGRIFMGGSDGSLYELVLSGAAAAGGVRVGLAGGLSVALTEFVVDAGGRAKRAALDALALAGKPEARLVNHGIPLLQSLLSAVLGSSPSGGYPVMDLCVDHERGMLALLALDGRVELWSVGPAGDELTHVKTVLDLDAACKSFLSEGDPKNKPRPELFAVGRAGATLRKHKDYPGQPGLDLPKVLAYLEHSTLPAAWPAVSVSFLSSTESRRVHLVLTTASGTRLYFTTLAEARYRELNSPTMGGGMPMSSTPGASSAADALGPGRDLKLVYIRMPPPAVTQREYNTGAYAVKKPEGWEPSGTGAADAAAAGSQGLPFGVSGRDVVAVSGRSALFGLGAGLKATPLTGPLTAHPAGAGYTLLALNRDYLKRSSTSVSGGVDRSGAGWAHLSYGESVTSLPLPHRPLAVAEVPAEPSHALDCLFTRSGALLLPDGETAPLPPSSWAIRTGQGCDLTGPAGGPSANVSSVPDPRAGTKRPRQDDVPESGLAPAAGMLVGQAGLTSSGVPERSGHVVRRRLWDSAPGYGIPQTVLGMQHEARASACAWDVLTAFGVTRYVLVRPIDQVASVLSRLDSTGGGVGSPGGQPPTALYDSRFAELRASFPLKQELYYLIASIACRSMDASVQGVTLASLRPASLTLQLGLSGDDATRHAAEVLRLSNKPSWRPDALRLGKDDLTFSPAMSGLLWYIARAALPVWTASLFIIPPAPEHRLLPTGVIRVGTKRVGLSGTAAAAAFVKVEDVLLPRYTSAECVLLARRLSAISDYMRRAYPIIASLDGVGPAGGVGGGGGGGGAGKGGMTMDRVRTAAREAGMEREFGFEEGEGSGGGGATMDDAAKTHRAYMIESLYVILTYRLVTRSCEACHFMAAVADPSFGGVSVLAGAGRDKAGGKGGGAHGLAYSASNEELLSAARTMTWDVLVTSPAALPFADGLCSRMIEALREKAGREHAAAAGQQAVAAAAQQVKLAVTGFGLGKAALTAAALAPGVDGATGGRGGDEAETLAKYMRERCPSFFSEGSRLRVAAASLAEKAARSANPAERAALIAQSASLASQAVQAWATGGGHALGPSSLVANLTNLLALTGRWRTLGAHSLVIRLLAEAAEGTAGGRAATSRLPEDAPVEGGDAATLSPSTHARMRCYAAIVDAIKAVESGVDAPAPTGTIQRALWQELLGEALQWPDALLHDTVYRWLEEDKVHMPVLLSQDTPYLEDYFTRRCSDPDVIVSYFTWETRGKYARE